MFDTNASVKDILDRIMEEGWGRERAGYNSGAWMPAEFADAINISEEALRAWRAGDYGVSPRNQIKIVKVAAQGRPDRTKVLKLPLRAAVNRENKERRKRKKQEKEAALNKIGPYIENIHFCLPDSSNFCQDTERCRTSRVNFAKGTRKVHISFDIKNAKYGTPFIRRWYRNGEKFRELRDVYDDVWPGWTFLYDRKGLAPGKYSLRLFIDDKVFDKSFTVKAGLARKSTS